VIELLNTGSFVPAFKELEQNGGKGKRVRIIESWEARPALSILLYLSLSPPLLPSYRSTWSSASAFSNISSIFLFSKSM
jgi:hypothetical protein